MALKSTPRDRDASPYKDRPELMAAEQIRPKAQNAYQDEIDRNDDVEQPWDDQDKNAGEKRDDWLEMSKADDHDGVPIGCMSE